MSLILSSLPSNKEAPLLGLAAENQALLRRVFRSYMASPFTIRFWDDSIWQSNPAQSPSFEIWLRTHTAWQQLLHGDDELGLGRSYIDGELRVGGDLFLALRSLPAIQQAARQAGPKPRAAVADLLEGARLGMSRLAHWGVEHSRERDAAAIAFHYDKPTAFYRLLLGPSMVYSCAYFRSWSDTLEAAQRTKMDLICQKLGLQQDQNFLDVGCGWGSLVLHAAEHYGVSARGITISRAQAEYAQARCAALRSHGYASVSARDYRELGVMRVAFDRAASVGMCEHVGDAHIEDYFQRVYDTLRPGGLFLNHGITRSHEGDRRHSAFIEQYVFPDGEILPLSRLIKAAEGAGFEVRDVEDLREHYEETLHRWVEALDANEDEAVSLAGKQSVRIWKLYLAGSAEAFRRGEIGVHQMLLAKKDAEGRSSAFTNRADLYSGRES